MPDSMIQVEVEIHRTPLHVGETEAGPKTVEVFSILGGAYLIWCSYDKYRWARAVRGKPELRMSISGHGSCSDLQAAVSDCLINYMDRERVRVVDLGGAIRPIPGVCYHCRFCNWEGCLPPSCKCPTCKTSTYVQLGSR